MLEFISLFDTRTTIFLVSIAFFIQASAIGFQAVSIREYKGVSTVLLGNFSLALGFFLNIFQGSLPDVITIVISNLLLLQGPNLFYIAFSRFLGDRFDKKIIIVLSLAILAITTYYTYVSYDTGARIIGTSICTGTSILVAAHKLWKTRKQTYRLGVWLTLLPLTVYGLFLYVRAIATIYAPPESAFSNTPVQTTTYLLLFVISFLWTIGFILMVSLRLQSDLRELATIDTLTRIPNRHATQTFFEREISRVQRHGGKFSILLIDIDNFKQINDKYGHALGDLALIKVAKIFDTSIRKQDIVGRWGGEEFLMILPDTPLQKARVIAERLRDMVSKTEIGEKDIDVNITISTGVASTSTTDTLVSILKKADDALYVAKATKNAVVAAD